MSYTVHQAKTNLSRLIKEAEDGREVIITRGKRPVAKLVALNPAQPAPEGPGGRRAPAADPFEPMTDEEMRELGLE